MSISAPEQERAVDPYSSNRYSSIINRLSRIVTSGSDVILYPFQSFILTRLNDTTVSIGPGICIKDDVLIHIKESFTVDFDDNDYYIDEIGDMELPGYYYIVLQYAYAKSLPAPKAWIRLIRNTAGLYHTADYAERYIFLGVAQVIFDSPIYRLADDPDCLYFYDPSNSNIVRPVQSGNWFYADGGVL